MHHQPLPDAGKQHPQKNEIKDALKCVQRAMRGKDPNELAAACSRLEMLIGAQPYAGAESDMQYHSAPDINDDGSMDADVQE